MLLLRHPAKPYRSRALVAGVTAVLAAGLVAAGSPLAHAGPRGVAPHRYGEIDCNGLSPIQRPVRVTLPCADPVGRGGYRFTDNGHYIGHDEPDIRFISSQPGSVTTSPGPSTWAPTHLPCPRCPTRAAT